MRKLNCWNEILNEWQKCEWWILVGSVQLRDEEFNPRKPNDISISQKSTKNGQFNQLKTSLISIWKTIVWGMYEVKSIFEDDLPLMQLFESFFFNSKCASFVEFS